MYNRWRNEDINLNKYFIFSNGNRTHNHTLVPLRHDCFIIVNIQMVNSYMAVIKSKYYFYPFCQSTRGVVKGETALRQINLFEQVRSVHTLSLTSRRGYQRAPLETYYKLTRRSYNSCGMATFYYICRYVFAKDNSFVQMKRLV